MVWEETVARARRAERKKSIGPWQYER